MKLLALIFVFSCKVIKRIKMLLYKSLFLNSGINVIFDPNDVFSYSTISIGNDVFIGPGATFSASDSSIKIGNKVMFGPNVTIMGGDHNVSIIGSYMFDVDIKLPENDQTVVFQDDVWVGANSIFLKGIVIGEGSIVAAGALVIKDVEPYSIVGGVPAKKLKMRFTEEQIEEHKRKLNVRN
jgi:acetyltransferase-like isoleucine patch superfamily enzyme